MPRPIGFLKSSADAQIEIQKLGAAFAQFRRTHKRGTRMPESFRARVTRALASGIPGSRVERVCGLSWSQVKSLRSRVATLRAMPPVQAPRVLSVVDEDVPAAMKSESIEIGFGAWRVNVTRSA